MKAEIGQLMRTLAPHMKEEAIRRGEPRAHGLWHHTEWNLVSTMGTTHWQIELTGERLGIYCWANANENPCYQFQYWGPKKFEEQGIPLDRIVQVHFALTQFLRKVEEWSPSTREMLWPIYAAAKDFPKAA